METNLILLIALGIAFNVSIRLILRGSRHFIGVDAMPAFPIAAGYLYGFTGGLWAGIVISVSYYFMGGKNISYAPLIVLINALVGAFSTLFAGWTFITAGFLLLFVYHAISLFVVSTLSEPGPGYFTFMVLNLVSSGLIIYFASQFI